MKYYEIKSLGIPAIPEIIKKVESGDSSLIPLVSYLTNNEVKENTTAVECIEWWKANQDKWALHQSTK
jgi:hypothetical protein